MENIKEKIKKEAMGALIQKIQQLINEELWGMVAQFASVVVVVIVIVY